MTSVWTNRGAGEDWSCEPLLELELEETMNASQPAAAAANVGPGGAVATGFWLQRDATRHHPGGQQTFGRATAAETRVGRWVNAGAGPTRLHLWCARSRDRLSANHLSRICIRTRLGSPVLIGVGVQASQAFLALSSATGSRWRRRWTQSRHRCEGPQRFETVVLNAEAEYGSQVLLLAFSRLHRR